MPNNLRELAVITARYHTHVHRALELRAATVLSTLESCDALRRPERFADFLLACEADVRGRKGLEERGYPQREYSRRRAPPRPPWRSTAKSAPAFRASRLARSFAGGVSPRSRH